jgi:transcription elongation factor Elf1
VERSVDVYAEWIDTSENVNSREVNDEYEQDDEERKAPSYEIQQELKLE